MSVASIWSSHQCRHQPILPNPRNLSPQRTACFLTNYNYRPQSEMMPRDKRSAQIPSTRLSAGLLEPHPKSCFFIHNREWIKVLSSQNSAPITQCISGCKTFYLTPLLFSPHFSPHSLSLRPILSTSPLCLISVILIIRARSWQAYGAHAKNKHAPEYEVPSHLIPWQNGEDELLTPPVFATLPWIRVYLNKEKANQQLIFRHNRATV